MRVRPRVCIGRALLVACALLVLRSGGVGCLADESAQDDLKARARDLRKEEAAWEAAREEEVDARAARWAALGIAGVSPLRPIGPPSRCLDLVIMGDGFASEDQEEYRDVVDRMAANFDTPPFDAYVDRMNIYRVDLVSAESGISLEGASVSTPLGGSVRPFVGGKLLTCDVQEAVRLAQAAVPDLDYLMVVLNTGGRFVGSANSGAIFLLSTAKGHQGSIVVHEFGHNFGGLYDEYVDPKQAGDQAPPERLRQGRNVGLEGNVHAAKWHYWNIPESVFRSEEPVSSFEIEDNVRCYEGGATFPDGVYRPEENCHMQRGRGKAFCRVCVEELEVALYRFFPPLESVSPAVGQVPLPARARQVFSVAPVRVGGDEDRVDVRWYLDGRRVVEGGRGARARKEGGPSHTLEVRASDLEAGTHDLTVTVDVLTPRVRMDRGRLASSYTWTVEVGSEASPDEPADIEGEVGVPLTVGLPEGDWVIRHGPPGAVLVAQDPRRVEWTPAEGQHGSWRLLLESPEGPCRIHAQAILVRPAKRRPNRAPKPVFQPPLPARAGESVACVLRAWDPDADHLVWSADTLPAGATLDPNTGAFAWGVPHVAVGHHALHFEATDGRRRLDVDLEVQVEGVPTFHGVFRMPPPAPVPFEAAVDRQVVGLHHPLPAVRLAHALALDDAPRSARLAVALRLWREESPALVAWSRETLDRMLVRPEEGAEAPLDLFLDLVRPRVWELVDRPEDRALLARIVERALERASLSKEERGSLESLGAILGAIDAYGRERRERDPAPPITDKKYR